MKVSLTQVLNIGFNKGGKCTQINPIMCTKQHKNIVQNKASGRGQII